MAEKQRIRQVLLTALSLLVFLVFMWQKNLAWAKPVEVFWTVALYVICCIPILIYVFGHKFRIPLMPLWAMGYFAMFGMPMLNQEQQWVGLGLTPEDQVAGALRLATLGGATCLLVFYTPLGDWVEKLVPRPNLPWNINRAAKIGVLFSIIGLSFYFYDLTSPPSATWGQLISLASKLGTIGIVTLFLLQLRGHLGQISKIFLWGVAIPVQFLMALGTGAIWQIILVGSPLLFCYCIEYKVIPWKGLFVFCILIIPFLGTKGEYRSYAWHGESTEEVTISTSPIQRGIAFIDLTKQRMLEGGVETYTVAAETAGARVNHLELLVLVREETPSVVPFWRGETYSSLLWAPVPRFLFPNKPRKTLGQEFGHRYQILSDYDFTTSINLPHQIVEMYINFGTVGVFFGMAFLGLLYRALLTLLDRPNSGERGIVIGSALLANMMSLDTDMSLVIGGMIYFLAIMFVATRLLQTPQEDILASTRLEQEAH